MVPSSKAARPPVWILPNLLSLDAPLVAVVWQWFLASDTGIPLRTVGCIVLGLTVWLIYIADRLLDVRDPSRTPLTARHAFYRNHQRLMVGLLCAIAMVDLYLAVFHLRPAVFRGGAMASMGVFAYMAGLHGPGSRFRMPKEISVAILFTLGTFTVAISNASDPTVLAVRAVAFGVLCLANLVLIERWEWRELRAPSENPPHPVVIVLCKTFPFWVLPLAALSATGGVWYRAIAISAVATLALFQLDRKLPIEARRALADGVLLTPILFLR